MKEKQVKNSLTIKNLLCITLVFLSYTCVFVELRDLWGGNWKIGSKSVTLTRFKVLVGSTLVYFLSERKTIIHQLLGMQSTCLKQRTRKATG